MPGLKKWHRKLFRTRGTINHQDTFAWRKITFLWSDSKNWGGEHQLLLPPASYTYENGPKSKCKHGGF